MPTGTAVSASPSAAFICFRSSSERLRHDLGAVSVPHRPFLLDAQTEHRSTLPFLACSSSAASCASLQILPTPSTMSRSARVTDLHSEKVRMSSTAPDWRASLIARTQSSLHPGPNVKSASSSALISRSIHPSRFSQTNETLAPPAPPPRRFFLTGRSSSDSEEEYSPSDPSFFSPRRKAPNPIPCAPSLYMPALARLRGPCTRKRASTPHAASCAASSSRRLTASGSISSQNFSDWTSTSVTSPTLKVAVLKVFPAREPIARCSARL